MNRYPRISARNLTDCGGECRAMSKAANARFGAARDWLRTQSVEVKPHDADRQSGDNLGNAVLVQAVSQDGLDWLPLFVPDGEIISQGDYRGREKRAAPVGPNQAGPAAVASPNKL